ncbi:MAG: 4-alpha-glucanotransferase, partial [Gemmataceae bacterium]
MPTLPRSAGVLLHPTSLPGPFGVGDLGPIAHRWLDTLAAAQQSWWQILPLGPTGYGDSPYQSFSAFAGNINLLSPELLEKEGFIDGNWQNGLHFAEGFADFDRVAPWKMDLVRRAYANFGRDVTSAFTRDFTEYRQQQAYWLNDYATFMAIRDALGGATLGDWPADLRRRAHTALAAMEKELAGEIEIRRFGQYLFDRQWNHLKQAANAKGIRIIGDIPIFVSGDSSDVWSNPGAFLVDAEFAPIVVAGVPPDYFSEDGQHWGNPLYNWKTMHADGYRWWVRRVQRTLEQTD